MGVKLGLSLENMITG